MHGKCVIFAYQALSRFSWSITMRPLTILLFVSLASASLFGQWVQTSGPSGGGVIDFTIAGNKIFAASFAIGNGIYASNDKGMTWTESGLQGITISHIVANGNTLIASSTQNSYNETDTIYRSDDVGITWKKVLTVSNINRVSSIGSRRKEWILSIEGSDGAFYISDDDGLSWDKFKPAFNFAYPIPLVFGGDTLIAATNISGLPAIYRSIDGGKSWIQSVKGLDSMNLLHLQSEAISGNTIWLGGTGGVTYSTDNGYSWKTPANKGLENKRLENIISIAGSGNHLLALSSLNNLYYSWDAAVTWTKYGGNDLPQNRSVFFSLLYIDSSNYLLGSSSGILRSGNEGNNWLYETEGLRCAEISALTFHNDKLFAATDRGVAYSEDEGVTWHQPQNLRNLLDVNISGFMINGTDVYAYGDRIYLWDGTSWNEKPYIKTSGIISACSHGESGKILVATNGIDPVADTCRLQIFDGSNEQMGLSFANSIDTEYSFVPNCVSARGKIYITVKRALSFLSFSNSYVMLRSADEGVSWTQTSLPFTPSFIYYAAGFFFMGTEDKGLYRSMDDGLTWQPLGFNSTGNIHSLVKNGENLFASVTSEGSDGLYVSNDNGSTWRYKNFGTYNIAGVLAMDDTYLYSSGSSVWRRPLNQLSVKGQSNNSENISLQVFPNPATEYIRLEYALPIEGNLIIYDEKGSIIIRQNINVSDEGKTISVSGFSSGIYQVSLLDKTGYEVSNSRFILIRK
jgi:photosystem II stability/assembly factor-like uncharacterized protein